MTSSSVLLSRRQVKSVSVVCPKGMSLFAKTGNYKFFEWLNCKENTDSDASLLSLVSLVFQGRNPLGKLVGN